MSWHQVGTKSAPLGTKCQSPTGKLAHRCQLVPSLCQLCANWERGEIPVKERNKYLSLSLLARIHPPPPLSPALTAQTTSVFVPFADNYTTPGGQAEICANSLAANPFSPHSPAG